MRRIAWIALITVLLGSAAAQADGYVYRYVNDDGVKVIDDAVPPQFVKNGYEVLTRTGRVVRTVAPAPTEKDLAAREARRAAEKQAEERRQADAMLLRRYSTVADIRAAKKRRLAELEAKIAVLRGNLSGVNAQIADVQAQAAVHERAGRDVPEVLIEQLAGLKAERRHVEQSIDRRQEELDAVAAEYEADIDRFKVITGLTDPDETQPENTAASPDNAANATKSGASKAAAPNATATNGG